MADTRQKNTRWELPLDFGGNFTMEGAHLAVLMDIRDELQRLNALLHCGNFTAIPFKLERIAERTEETARNTKKKRKRRVKLRAIAGGRGS